MQFAAVSHVPSSVRNATLCGALSLCAFIPAHAAAPIVLLDEAAIASLELHAQQATPRDQVQLYADLTDKISLLAAKQIAEGELEKAEITLRRLEACTAQIEAGLQRDTKNLKKTEVLLHTTHRRLTDLARSAGDIKPSVQSAVASLDHVQTALLAAVFEH